MTPTITAPPMTISLAGGQNDVLAASPNGGNVRSRPKPKVKWQNNTGRLVRLSFSELTDDGSAGASLWPFNKPAAQPGVVWDANEGIVWLGVGKSFEGTIADAGQVVLKYDVDVMSGSDPASPGEVDGGIVPLDPLIIVEK